MLGKPTLDNVLDDEGETGAKGPFLLKEVAATGGLGEVDGVPAGEPGEQGRCRGVAGAGRGEGYATRGVICGADGAACCDEDEEELPCCEDGDQCPGRPADGIVGEHGLVARKRAE